MIESSLEIGKLTQQQEQSGPGGELQQVPEEQAGQDDDEHPHAKPGGLLPRAPVEARRQAPDNQENHHDLDGQVDDGRQTSK